MALKVFISYSRWNKPFADRLKVDLGRAGVDAWLDTTDIVAGRSWRQEIAQNIESSSSLILLASPESSQSRIVAEELAYARHCGKEVIPVHIGGSVDDLKPEWRALHLLNFRDGAYWEMLPQLFAGLQADLKVPSNYRHFLNQPGITLSQVAQQLHANRSFLVEGKEFAGIPLTQTGYSTTWLLGPADEPLRLPREIAAVLQFTGRATQETDYEVVQYLLQKGLPSWVVSVRGPINYSRNQARYELLHRHCWEDAVQTSDWMFDRFLKGQHVRLFFNAPLPLLFAFGAHPRGMFQSCHLYHYASGQGYSGDQYEHVLSVDRM